METACGRKAESIIGVVGGVGPYAGLDLVRKIFDQTLATGDLEHLPVALLSFPELIGDRTGFLLGSTGINPGYALAEILCRLESVGATVAGIPCNTAHAPAIFGAIRSSLSAGGHSIRVLHMIDEVARSLMATHPGIRRIGVLSTIGTFETRVYPDVLEPLGFKVLAPGEETRALVHQAIYDPVYGIKGQSDPVTGRARHEVLEAIEELRRAGAEAVILGCTELPLAVTESQIGEIAIIDATLILARGLIRETNPAKLRPLPGWGSTPPS